MNTFKISFLKLAFFGCLFFCGGNCLSQKNQESLTDSLFQYHQSDSLYRYQTDEKAVFIGNLFHPNKRHAVIAYYKNDSTIQLSIREQFGNDWNVVMQQGIPFTYDEMFPSDFMKLEDFDGDEQSELF